MARTKTNKGRRYNRYNPHYDSDYKWQVYREYLRGIETKLTIRLRNGIKGNALIVVWLR